MVNNTPEYSTSLSSLLQTSPSLTTWKPSPAMVKTLELVLENPELRLSIAKISEQVGVTKSAIYRWFKECPKFVEAWELVPKAMLRLHTPQAMGALIKKASEGDVSALRLFFEIRGLKSYHVVEAGNTNEPQEPIKYSPQETAEILKVLQAAQKNLETHEDQNP